MIRLFMLKTVLGMVAVVVAGLENAVDLDQNIQKRDPRNGVEFSLPNAFQMILPSG